MEEGFLPDFARANVLQQGWAKGIPRLSRLGRSIKIRRQDLIAVLTFRCTQCGYLESYSSAT